MCCQNNYVVKTENNLDLFRKDLTNAQSRREKDEELLKSRQRNELLDIHLNNSFRVNNSALINDEVKLKKLEEIVQSAAKIKLKVRFV